LKEAGQLFQVIRMLRGRGKGIIYISHRLEETFEIADRVTVLRDGRHIATNAISEVKVDDLIRMMIGRTLSDLFPKKEVEKGEVQAEPVELGQRGADRPEGLISPAPVDQAEGMDGHEVGKVTMRRRERIARRDEQPAVLGRYSAEYGGGPPVSNPLNLAIPILARGMWL
jgi:ABC-type multidrug transport system ATPase subunit